MQAQDRISDYKEQSISLPSIFIGIGSPMVAIEYDDWTDKLCNFLENIPHPKGIIIMTPRWKTDEYVHVMYNELPEQLYDFDDAVSDTLYKLTYPCDGDLDLAKLINDILNQNEIKAKLDDSRGMDYAAWVPLYVTYPNIDVPIVQLSIPNHFKPRDIMKMGNILAELRKKGILILGTGNIVYNKSLADFNNKYSEADGWAKEIDRWFDNQLKNANIKNLLDFRNKITNVEKGIVDESNLLPLYFVLGTMRQKDHYFSIYEGFYYKNVAMRTFALVNNR
ncbi:MAG: dioxygenase [Candidatus Heimdallarchaeota archaeon]|nr:dioxygenase [Candidatus Heimdallarchaeota archaeon]